MSRELVHDLHEALDAVEDDRECRVAILTGAGRGFCAGLDLKETGDVAAEVGGGPPAGVRAPQHLPARVGRRGGALQAGGGGAGGAGAGGGVGRGGGGGGGAGAAGGGGPLR